MRGEQLCDLPFLSNQIARLAALSPLILVVSEVPVPCMPCTLCLWDSLVSQRNWGSGVCSKHRMRDFLFFCYGRSLDACSFARARVIRRGKWYHHGFSRGGETCALLSLVESPAGLAHYWEERVVKAGVGWLMGGLTSAGRDHDCFFVLPRLSLIGARYVYVVADSLSRKP